MIDEASDLWEQWGDVEVPTLLHACRWGFDFDAVAYRLQNDPMFAIEMRLCRDWKIPHSEFLSWCPEDQAKALAHMAYEAQRCGQCGIHPTDWPDPMEPVFEAAVKVCPGCAEMDRYQRHIKEQSEGQAPSAMDGVKPYLKRVGEAE